MKSKLTAQKAIEGNLQELMKKYNLKQDTLQVLPVLHEYMFSSMRTFHEEFTNEVYRYLLFNKNKYFPEELFDYAGKGLIANAIDAAIARFLEEDFHMSVRYSGALTSSSVSVIVSDNALGIDPSVEPKLGKEKISTKPEKILLDPNFRGGYGIHIYHSVKNFELCGGVLEIKNLGYKKGVVAKMNIDINKLHDLPDTTQYIDSLLM